MNSTEYRKQLIKCLNITNECINDYKSDCCNLLDPQEKEILSNLQDEMIKAARKLKDIYKII